MHRRTLADQTHALDGRDRMPDVEEVRAAAERLRRARPPSAGALGGYGLAEAYDALVTAWSRHLAVMLAAQEAAREQDG
jgi:hypothetical protein